MSMESPTNHDHASGEFDRQCPQCNPLHLSEEELEVRGSADHESRAESPTTLPAKKEWPVNRVFLPEGVVSLAAVSPELENSEGDWWIRESASLGADAAAKRIVTAILGEFESCLLVPDGYSHELFYGKRMTDIIAKALAAASPSDAFDDVMPIL